MGWVQRHRRHGALLALAALALQITLAFGHVHLNVHLRGSAGDWRPAMAATHRPALAQASPQRPAQNPSDGDDYCAICASIFLASTSFTPAPPQLLVPIGFQRIEHSFDSARDCAEPRRFAFQSRAPPAA